MGKYYEDEIILKQITARLVPPNNTYPDCVCKVLMTEDFLYTLEDNFDGTYNCMFKIPFKQLLSVKKYIAQENSDGSIKNGGFGPSHLTIAIMALCGVIFIPGKRNQNAKSSEFLEIKYKNERDEICYLHFENCSSIKNMVNAFEKYKY